jgi:predicted nucleic acid-binding Zn ribbon protein
VHFNSVEQILTQLEQQPGWEKFQEYRQLLKCWRSTVNQTTAQHTRPLYIARQVLWVAVSSAARAQELSFQRYTLLKRLNKQLTFKLKDIRFSSSQWHQKDSSTAQPAMFRASKENSVNPTRSLTNFSRLQNSSNITTISSSERAKESVRQWVKSLKQNSDSSFSCPNCHSSTPKEEIERWNLCYHCVAAKWSEEYRPPIFPEPK